MPAVTPSHPAQTIELLPDNALEVTDLQKTYAAGANSHHAVRGVSFRIEPGNFYSLLGPSGCGKTTTLRCVAGLETSDSGVIRLGDTVMSEGSTHLPPDRRGVGMVFQNYAIWPHLSVFENVAFPLRVGSEKFSKSEIERRVGESLELVQLGELARRPAVAMSGGQQQRLALARALVRRPRLLLLDEPLSNLDAKLRDSMRTELRALQLRLGITTLYVTHDQAEALSMSDRVAVMSGGVIQQEGTPAEIYQSPKSRFVADFVGRTNLVRAVVLERVDADHVLLKALGTTLVTPSVGVDARVGDIVTLSVRPESIRSHSERPASGNIVVGTVSQMEFFGEMHEYHVKLDGVSESLTVRCGAPQAPRTGDQIHLELTMSSCRILESRDTGAASADAA